MSKVNPPKPTPNDLDHIAIPTPFSLKALFPCAYFFAFDLPLRVKVVVSVFGRCRCREGVEWYMSGREIVMLRSVGARSLDVAGLLAAVADTLVRGLGWALAAQVAGLAACESQRSTDHIA